MTGRVGALLWRELRRDPRALVRIGGWSVLEAAPSFFIGYAVAHAIEDGFAAHRVVPGLAWLAALGGVWLLAALGARQVVLAVAATVEPFRDRLLARVVGAALDRAGHARMPPDTGSVARTNLQVELARDSFAAVITVLRSFVFTVAGVTIGMATLMPQVLLLVVPPFALGLLVFALSLPALGRRQRAFLLADEATVGTCTEVVGGLRDIAASGAEDVVLARTGARITAQAAAGRGLARATALRSLALGLGGWAPIAGLLVGTPWLLRQGADAGVVIGALTYVTQSLTPALGGLVDGLGASGVRLTVTLERILEAAAPTGGRPGSAAPRSGRVELREVTFGYGPQPVVAGLDLLVPHGDHLAVIGPSGIGKSTLAGLVTGMLAPDAGTVTVGGLPAGRLRPDARVLIPQEAYIFRGTLWENLTYLYRATPNAVDEAVLLFGLAGLVRRLGGYRAVVDPGALSAGERQLIALVRAYLAPAGLTVLDEATCHLDPVAEARAEAAFAARGGTLLIIAHRLSSALRARRVLLLDGTRAHLGTHAELLESVPLYAELMGHWNLHTEREFAP